MLSFDLMLRQFGLDPSSGCQFVPASAFIPPVAPHAEGADRAWSELHDIAPYRSVVMPFPAMPTRPLIIVNIDYVDVAAIAATLQRRYPHNHYLYVNAEQHVSLHELASMTLDQDYLYLPALTIEADLRGVDTLEWIMARLAGPFGCPWDREQTHETLRQFLLEETHETLEALDAKNWHDVSEELGDLLLQVMFHAELGRQADRFDLGDIASAINTKLLRRHPHIFGNTAVSGSAEVLRNWEAIKATERAEQGKTDRTSALDGIPKTMPLLAAAQLMSRKAAKVGFDWGDIDGVWAKIHEELDELKIAEPAEREGELGDILFAVTNLARWLHVDAESALRGTIAKFRRRFQAMEQALATTDRTLNQLTPAEADQLWEIVKRQERV